MVDLSECAFVSNGLVLGHPDESLVHSILLLCLLLYYLALQLHSFELFIISSEPLQLSLSHEGDRGIRDNFMTLTHTDNFIEVLCSESLSTLRTISLALVSRRLWQWHRVDC